jgi:Zn-finger nucleic acid-binding protein
MSAYRDRPLQCPRCNADLQRDGSKEIWGCPKCGGTLMGIGELITALLEIAPSLLPEGNVRSITTLGRHGPPLRCPTCAGQMEPVFLGGVDVERCYHDEQLWLDRGEPKRVFDRAAAQQQEHTADEGWLDKLRRWLAD